MKKSFKLTVFLIPIGIAINIIGGQIAMLLKLPLFLDAIGTITVGALCGVVPGIIVGAITSLGISITNPTTLAYIGISVLWGILGAVFSKKGVFIKLWKTVLAGIGMGIIGGGLGSTISVLFFGGFGPGATGIISGTLMSVGFPVVISSLISEMFTDLVDKIPTVIIVYIILMSIPVRTLLKLPLGEVFIKAKQSADRKKVESEEKNHGL
ncbi:hypothetical protein [Bacillus salipaludis]|uniref:ECF transporter S component n=1 Tax=Bacillus salipaludis TaxID=2547811 RepID=A0ABW8RFX1_9BACI